MDVHNNIKLNRKSIKAITRHRFINKNENITKQTSLDWTTTFGGSALREVTLKCTLFFKLILCLFLFLSFLCTPDLLLLPQALHDDIFVMSPSIKPTDHSFGLVHVSNPFSFTWVQLPEDIFSLRSRTHSRGWIKETVYTKSSSRAVSIFIAPLIPECLCGSLFKTTRITSPSEYSSKERYVAPTMRGEKRNLR